MHEDKDSHIDPELFDLFLHAGIYREYAQRYMPAEQIDEVDIEQYLTSPAWTRGHAARVQTRVQPARMFL